MKAATHPPSPTDRRLRASGPRPAPAGPIRLAAALALLPSLFLAGCGEDATPPPPPDGGDPQFEATLDPGSASFVLSRVSGGADVALDLVGSHLVLDVASGTVSLDVALRNAAERELADPAVVWLRGFRPQGVEVLNADHAEPWEEDSGAQRFGFDYAGLFGADGVLSPNETSQPRTWTFRVPGQASFSFSASASFGAPGGAVLGGSVFHDFDRNGVRDATEPPFSGEIAVARPDGTQERVGVSERGQYRVRVREAGLYLVSYRPPRLDCRCNVLVTTPNPLEVVIVPDSDGQPQDFLGADFGAHVVQLGDEGRVVLTDRPPDQIRQDPYSLDAIALRGDVLAMRVGFGGCTADHDFTLFMSGGFMESEPVQARLVLGHDDLEEPCDAHFERTLHFDLRPLREAYERQYDRPGRVRLRLADLRGQEHEFLYEWGPVPGEN